MLFWRHSRREPGNESSGILSNQDVIPALMCEQEERGMLAVDDRLAID